MRARFGIVAVATAACAGCWLFADIDKLSARAFPADVDGQTTFDASRTDADGANDGGVVSDAGTCNLSVERIGPIALVSGQENAVGIAVDPAPCGQGAIFWTRGNCSEDGGVFAADKDGGRPRVLALGISCAIATSASHVAWAAYGGVGSARIDGGNQGFITTEQGAYQIALSGDVMYWGGTYTLGLHRAGAEQIGCPGSSCLLLDTASGVFNVAVEASGVYWTEIGDTAGDAAPAVRTASLDGGARRLIDEGPEEPHSLAFGPERIYWIAKDTLRTAARDGGAATVLVPNSSAAEMVVAGDRLYWTVRYGTEVRSCNLAGRDVRVEATGQDKPAGIAADDLAVYWVNRGSGTIMRLAR